MIEPTQVDKLIIRLEDLVSCLSKHRDFTIHQNINQFYFMYKAVELKVLLEKYDEAQEKLEAVSNQICTSYSEIAHQWSKDVRSLNRYLHHRQE